MIVGEFATLKVLDVARDGAFLDWGRPKDLFLPWDHQDGKIVRGDELVVFITLDRRQSPMASMRLDDYLKHDPSQLQLDQKVDLLIISQGDLGFEAIIDGQHLGMLYHSEVFQSLGYGDRIAGYIKKIRDDGKVDVMLAPSGNRGTPELSERILEELRNRGGYLEVTEKSAPEVIHDLFGVSKNKYKMALGGLYKNRRITLHPDGVRLVQPR